MRVLIVHHGRRPTPDQPVSGGALRAQHLGDGLEGAGHEVLWLHRDQDGPSGFDGHEDLYAKARALGPDRIIAVQLEDAPPLAAVGAPLAVDLYAPRLLEASFEGTLRWTGVEALRALAAGDVFLVSNARQRWFWLGVLALAGIDVRDDPTLHVPLVAPAGPRRRHPKTPVLVAGGAHWPWHDPRPALDRALQHLDARGTGKIVWYGGPREGQPVAWALPSHPRLEPMGWVDPQTLLKAYASATAAFDWMGTNSERGLAFSFRHADYLGCGLPILTHADTALSDLLGDAGWASNDIESVLDEVLDNTAEVKRRGISARTIAKKHLSLGAATAPVVDWVESGHRHRRIPTDLVEHAQLAADAAAARTAQASAAKAQARAEAEVSRKRAEMSDMVGQVQSLTRVVDRLSRAVDEVAGFKREAITVLGNQSESATRSLSEANQEIALLRADIEKKTAELAGMDDLRRRLENDIENLRKEIKQLRQRGVFRR
jgi:hypothetical protein